MKEKEIEINIEDKIIKIGMEELIKLLPNESIKLLPKEDTSTLMVGIPIKKLEEVGFSLKDYELVFEINKKDKKLYMTIYDGCDDFIHLINKSNLKELIH